MMMRLWPFLRPNDFEPLKANEQRASGDSQPPRCPGLVPSLSSKRFQYACALRLLFAVPPVVARVDVARIDGLVPTSRLTLHRLERQVVGLDVRAVCKDPGALDHVAELADVSWPGVGLKESQSVMCESRCGSHAFLACQLLKNSLGQRTNLTQALTQGWDLQPREFLSSWHARKACE